MEFVVSVQCKSVKCYVIGLMTFSEELSIVLFSNLVIVWMFLSIITFISLLASIIYREERKFMAWFSYYFLSTARSARSSKASCIRRKSIYGYPQKKSSSTRKRYMIFIQNKNSYI